MEHCLVGVRPQRMERCRRRTGSVRAVPWPPLPQTREQPVPDVAPVRGVRRIEILTEEPLAAAEFHARLLKWVVLPAVDGSSVACWVGDRLTVALRPPTQDEQPGW